MYARDRHDQLRGDGEPDAQGTPRRFRRRLRRYSLIIAVLLVGSVLANAALTGNDHGGPGRANMVATSGPGWTVAPLPGPSQGGGRQEVVASDVTNTHPDYWGQHKSRIVRLPNGDLYLTYNAADGTYHVMKRAVATGRWSLVYAGPVGQEPVNIVATPDGTIHTFPYVDKTGTWADVASADGGQTWTTTPLPGTWDGAGQGYSGVDVNARGTIVAGQTDGDVPGHFFLATRDPTTGQWTYADQTLAYRYTYGFFLPGPSNDLSIVATRDLLDSEADCSDSGTYVLDRVRVFHLAAAQRPSGEYVSSLIVQEPCPASSGSGLVNILTQAVDAYLDTNGLLHVLYDDGNRGGGHQAVIDPATGRVLADQNVQALILDGFKDRLIQDMAGRFYLLSMETGSSMLRVVPALDGDTNGTHWGTPVDIDLGSAYPLQGWGSFNLACPRTGTALADYVDGDYQSNGSIVYFRVRLNVRR